jgi:hypothetical protein
MSMHKVGKFKRFIAFAINAQFVLASSAFSSDEQWEKAVQITNIAGGLTSQILQGNQQLEMQQMAASQQQALSQKLSIKPVQPSTVPSILTQNGCFVLEAKSDTTNDMCDRDKFDPMKAQSGYYSAILNIAENNESQLTNFLTHGHETSTAQGLGCYEKSLKQFTATLNARVEMLNELEAGIKAEVEAFEKLAEQDMEDLKKGNALLEGTPAEYLKDFKFEEKFNDPQCASFMGAGEFKKNGQGGFRAIQNILDQKVDTPAKGALTPSQLKSKTSEMKADIRKIAKAVAKQASADKTMSGEIGLTGIRTKSQIDKTNPALVGIINELKAEANLEVANLERQLKKDTTGNKDASGIIDSIKTDSIDLDNWAFNYERDNKNVCLTGYVQSNFKGAQGLVGRLSDPNISKKANQQADSSYKNAIVSILNDSEYTIEEKIKLIRKSEAKSTNSRYAMTTGKSINIKGKEVGASTRIKASDMISIFTDNCTQQFESKRTSSGKSKREILKSLRSFKRQRNKIHRKYVRQVKQDIISKMTNCPADTSTGTGALSCDNALQPKSQNFCIRTANVCANNMIACKDKADKIVKTTRSEQKKIAKRYKKSMKQFKNRLVTQFKGVNAMMKASGRQLDGMYKMGSIYKTPVGLDLSLLTNKLSKEEGIDPTLKIEDPKQYLAMMTKNIAKLKESVVAANKEILNGPQGGDKINGKSAGKAGTYAGFAGELKKYEDNYTREKGNWGKTVKQCKNLIAQYNKQQTDQFNAANEKNQEMNAEKTTICKKLMAFEANPSCGKAEDLGDEVLKIAAISAPGDMVATGNINAFAENCNSFNSDGGSNEYDDFDSYSNNKNRSVASVSPEDFCEDNKKWKTCITYGESMKALEKEGYKRVCNSEDPELDDYKKEVIDNDDKFKALFKKKYSKNNLYRIEECDKYEKIPANKKDLLSETGYKCLSPKKPRISSTKVKGHDDLVKSIPIKSSDLNNTKNKALRKEILANFDDKDFAVDLECKHIKDGSKGNLSKSLAAIKKQIRIKQKADTYSDIGDIKVAACSATASGGAGKGTLGMGQQQGRNMAGGMGSFVNGGQ